MIGEHNRDNPYIIQILENLEPLKSKTIESAKAFVKYEIMTFIFTIAFILYIRYIEGETYFFILGYWMIISIGTIFIFISTYKRNPIPDITSIIYGNQYEKIYVNNERLLKMIEGMAAFDSRLSSFKQTAESWCIAYSVYLLIGFLYSIITLII